jgi:hypothetical protein
VVGTRDNPETGDWRPLASLRLLTTAGPCWKVWVTIHQLLKWQTMLYRDYEHGLKSSSATS